MLVVVSFVSIMLIVVEVGSFVDCLSPVVVIAPPSSITSAVIVVKVVCVVCSYQQHLSQDRRTQRNDPHKSANMGIIQGERQKRRKVSRLVLFTQVHGSKEGSDRLDQ